MAESDTGLRRLLRVAWIYELLQNLMGADGNIRRFVREDLRPSPGMRILDVGCGTGRLARYLGPVTYVGYEPNQAYIEAGRRENAGRDVTLHLGYFDETAAQQLEAVDLVVVSAVLHHMSNSEARGLFALLARVLKPGGRVVTLDNVYVPEQGWLARWLISLDRGRDVRTPGGYAALAEGYFGIVDGHVLHHRRIPYTYWIMTCRDPVSPPPQTEGQR